MPVAPAAISRSTISRALQPDLIRRTLDWCPALQHWPARTLDALSAASRFGHYKKHEPILAGDRRCRDVLVLASGRVEVGGVDALGARFVLSLHGGGDIIGLARLLDGRAFVFDYHARAETALVRIPARALRSALDAHPVLWRGIALLALERMHEQIAAQQHRAFTPLPQRLAHVLLHLARSQGQAAAHRPGALDICITQSDLAAMACTSRQSINQALRGLRAAGCLQTAWGRITVLDLLALERMAGLGVEKG